MFIKFSARVLSVLDRLFLVPFLDYETYFNIHKKLGFPIKKLFFLYSQRYRLNLDNPVTFNEKVVYRQLFERDPLLPIIVDKYEVREYVKEKIGEKYLIPLFQLADSFDDIDFSKLPNDYIMKMTHASGQNIIFKDGKNNKGYDREALKKTFEGWFAEKYRFQQLIWFVQPIKRRIIVEKLLEDEQGKIPKDYKFFVFDGRVEFILVVHGRFLEHAINLYYRDWSVAEFTFDYEGKDVPGEVEKKPHLLSEMISLSEKLAADFTDMRVDLYTVGSNIYFGELTPCHGGAYDRFIPGEYDEYYGKKWKNSKSLLRDRVDGISINEKKNDI